MNHPNPCAEVLAIAINELTFRLVAVVCGLIEAVRCAANDAGMLSAFSSGVKA